VIVRLQPMVEMYLIQIPTHEFFPQLVRLAANERHLQPSKHGDQELGRPIGIDTTWLSVLVTTNKRCGYRAMSRRRLTKAMRSGSHLREP
jgi:hypothetical protein